MCSDVPDEEVDGPVRREDLVEPALPQLVQDFLLAVLAQEPAIRRSGFPVLESHVVARAVVVYTPEAIAELDRYPFESTHVVVEQIELVGQRSLGGRPGLGLH